MSLAYSVADWFILGATISYLGVKEGVKRGLHVKAVRILSIVHLRITNWETTIILSSLSRDMRDTKNF